MNSDLLWKSNRVGVEFLMTDVSAGLTFLEVAGATALPQNRERSLKHAGRVYVTVKRLLNRVNATPEERLHLERKLEELHRGLSAAGYSVEPDPIPSP